MPIHLRFVIQRLHYQRDCLANPTGLEPPAVGKGRICYKCHQEGHVSTRTIYHRSDRLSTSPDCEGLYL